VENLEAVIAETHSGLAGLRVAAFESRRADETQRMLERFGAIPFVSPSLREVPLEVHPAALEFADALRAGQVETVIFLTGVGIRHLLTAIQEKFSPSEFAEALRSVQVIARGPKPVAVLRELGRPPDFVVREPNTWRELLELVDQKLSVAGQRLWVQEYGKSNPELLEGLAARGAEVHPIRVYGWELPDDIRPLEANVRRLAEGQLDVLLFTSSPQVLHLLLVAERLGLAEQLRESLSWTVVASIGPTTSETLREQGWPVDLEPEHPKLGQLLKTVHDQARAKLREKRSALSLHPAVARERGIEMTEEKPRGWNSLFLRACRGEPTERTPIWLMRQAGRYLPEYRRIREKGTFLELCYNPQLCAEVMLTTVERLGVDAAIIFADLLPILVPLGFDLEFQTGEGPVIHNPLRTAADVDRVRELEDMSSLACVPETVRLTRAGLPESIPVIGFAGAPFTLASYALEGGGSKNYATTKAFMYRDEGAWHALLEKLGRAVVRYLEAQIAAGAQSLQLFDSWVGCLGVDDYRRYVLPHSQAVLRALPREVPVIHFGAGNPALLPALAEAGGHVLGVDWRIPLDEAWKLIGPNHSVQGNLDPLTLLAPLPVLRERVVQILKQAGGRPGHIFNLGHGIVPQTPVENVLALIDMVKELSAQK